MVRKLLRHKARTGKLCFLYLRVSKGEKVQQSIPAQEVIARKAAEAAGYRVIAIYKDEKSRGVRRDGLHQMLEDLDANPQVGAVFFWDYRRLWGHWEQYGRLNARALTAGYRLVDSKGEDFTSETAMEKFVLMMKSGLSELETGTVGERVKETNTAKVELNQIVSRLPLGGIVTKTLNDDGQPRSVYSVNKHDMDIVRRIFTDYAANIPTYRIAENLRAEGVVTSKGKNTWSVYGLRTLIDNRFYIGEIHYNQTGTLWELDEVTGDKIKRKRARDVSEYLQGKSPLGVILAEDPTDENSVAAAIKLFNDCQKLRDRKGRERPQRVHERGVLDDLVYCHRCGKRMGRTLDSAKNRKTKISYGNFSYHCPYRSNIGTGCNRSHSMSEKRIFQELAKLVERRGLTVEGQSTWRPPAPDTRALDRAIGEAERHLAATITAAKQIEIAWKADVYEDVAEYKEDRAVARMERAQAEAALTVALEAKTPQAAPTPAMSESTATAFGELVATLTNEKLSLEKRRAGAARFIDRIDVDNPTIMVTLR